MKKIITFFMIGLGLSVGDVQAKDYGSIFYSDEAERYLEKWSSDKEWSEEVIKAQAAYNNKEYTVALENYEKAFELGYVSGQGAFNLADCYEHLGRMALAIEAYNGAIKLLRPEAGEEGTLFKAYYRLGLLSAEKKDYSQAAEFFEAARQLNMNDAQLLFNLGVVRQKQQKPEEAKIFYEAALGLDPSLKEAQTNLANLSSSRNVPQVIVSNPVLKQKSPLELMNINTLKGKNLDQKIESLKVQLDKAPKKQQGDLYYELGLYYYTAGKFDLALKAFKNVGKSQNAEYAHFLTGLISLKQGQVKEGIRAYRSHLRQNPKDPLGHYNLAILYDNEKNKNRKAIYHYRRYLQLAKEKAKDADDIGRRIWILSNHRNP